MNWLKVKPDDNLQHILDSISQPTTIYLTNGIYKQKLVIKCKNVKIIGEDREKVVISYNDYAKKQHEDGREFNTFRTYTVCVVGENVVLENLTVENSNEHPEVVGQCVALSVNAKSFLARNVILKSTQDTLFTSPFPDDLVIRYSGLTDDPTYYNGFIPREQLYLEGNAVQLFENCDIYGNVDYVFGCAEAYFKKCNFISIADVRGHGYVAAPAHSLKQQNGYAFVDCNFVCGGAGKGSVYLARPWRDFGKCQFVNCRLGEHISPLLFDKWNDTYRNNTARFEYFGLSFAAPVTPVEWSRQLDGESALDVIDRCEKAFAHFKE